MRLRFFGAVMVLSAHWGSSFYAEALDLGNSGLAFLNEANDGDFEAAAQTDSQENGLVIQLEPTAGRKTDYRPLIGEAVGPKGAL